MQFLPTKVSLNNVVIVNSFHSKGGDFLIQNFQLAVSFHVIFALCGGRYYDMA